MSVFVKAAAVAATVLVALATIPMTEFASAALHARAVRYVAADARQPGAHARIPRPVR
jgi:hypothetical protein